MPQVSAQMITCLTKLVISGICLVTMARWGEHFQKAHSAAKSLSGLYFLGQLTQYSLLCKIKRRHHSETHRFQIAERYLRNTKTITGSCCFCVSAVSSGNCEKQFGTLRSSISENDCCIQRRSFPIYKDEIRCSSSTTFF